MSSEFSDEIEALLSIYPNHIMVVQPSDADDNQCTTVQYSSTELTSDESNPNVISRMDNNYILSLKIPLRYPIVDQQIDKITLSLSFTNRIDSDVKVGILHELHRIIDNNVGEVVIYPIIQKLLEMMDEIATDNDNAVHDQLEVNVMDYETVKANRTTVFTAVPSTSSIHLHIIHGPVSTEQKSSFQAHLCPVHSMEEVAEFRRSVLSDKRIAKATHNIFAYRYNCAITG